MLGGGSKRIAAKLDDAKKETAKERVKAQRERQKLAKEAERQKEAQRLAREHAEKKREKQEYDDMIYRSSSMVAAGDTGRLDRRAVGPRAVVALQRLLQPVERRHDRDPGDGGQAAALEGGGARQHPAPPGQSLDPPIFRREGPNRQHRSGNPQPRALQTATLVDELHAQTVALALELTPAARAGAYLRHRHPDLARLVLARGEVPAAVPGRHRERQQVALAHRAQPQPPLPPQACSAHPRHRVASHRRPAPGSCQSI